MAGRSPALTRLGQGIAAIGAKVAGAHAVTAQAAADASRQRFAGALLEGFEVHGAKAMGKLLATVADTGVVPPEIAQLLDAAGIPKAQAGALVTQFLVWGVAFNIAAEILQPFLQAVQNELWKDHPVRPVDAAVAARAEAMGVLEYGPAQAEATLTGFDQTRFNVLAQVSRTWPGVGEVVQLLNRDLVDAGKATEILTRNAVPADLIPRLLDLRHAILPPAELALGLLRGNIDQGYAEAEAARSGVDPERLNVLTLNTGEPPGVMDLLSLWRRGLLDTARLERGIRQSRVRNEWIDTVKLMRIIPPTWADALEAHLEGQLPPAEARAMYDRLGGDPQYYDVLFNTRGQAPSPVEALDMLNRGIIPSTGTGPAALTFEQAFLEGPWRNKWLAPMEKLREYLPPPRTVTAMLRSGSLTHAQATELWRKSGLTPELAAAYAHNAEVEKTAPTKDLTVATIRSLYEDRVLDRVRAKAQLMGLGYDDREAEWELELVDVTRDKRFQDAALGRFHTLYVGHRITQAELQAAFSTLAVAPEQQAQLLTLWDLEREASVRELTVAQLTRAGHLGIMLWPTVRERLVAMGYLPQDADVLILEAGGTPGG